MNIGDIINGRYKILRQIGVGGMGAVYQVEDLELNSEIVAFKVLHQQSEVDPEVFQRFRNEVLIARSLGHPNIVRTHDLGRTQDGMYYITMEYVEGRTLKEVLRGLEIKSSDVREKLFKYFIDVLEGVSYAHSKGVIHRDLKPANILISKSGEAKIADFGTARSLELSEGLTKTGFSVGTPEYMSPEQIRGEVLDQACDIYSLGVLLYELLTGSKPFSADSPIGVAYKQLNDPLPNLEEKGFLGLESIQVVIDKATMKDKSERYANVKDLANDFKRAISNYSKDGGSGTFSMPRKEGSSDAWILGGKEENGSGVGRFKRRDEDRSLFPYFIFLGFVLALAYYFYTAREVPEVPAIVESNFEPEENSAKVEVVEELSPSPVRPVLPVVKPSVEKKVEVKEVVKDVSPSIAPSIEVSPVVVPSPAEIIKQEYLVEKLDVLSPDRSDSAFSSVFKKSELINIIVLVKLQEEKLPFSSSDIQKRTDLVVSDPKSSRGIDRLTPVIESQGGGLVKLVYAISSESSSSYPGFVKIDFKVDGNIEKGTFIKFAEFVVKSPSLIPSVSSSQADFIDPEVGGSPISNLQVQESPVESLGEQISFDGTIDILDPQNGIKEPHGFQLKLVKQADVVSGTARITGIGEYKVVGKYYERGIELELFGEKENLKLVGGKRETGFKGTFVSGSGGVSKGTWMVK